MKPLNESQLNRVSEFFANIAVAWFVAAFIGTDDFIAMIRYSLVGSVSLLISIMLTKKGKSK